GRDLDRRRLPRRRPPSLHSGYARLLPARGAVERRPISRARGGGSLVAILADCPDVLRVPAGEGSRCSTGEGWRQRSPRLANAGAAVSPFARVAGRSTAEQGADEAGDPTREVAQTAEAHSRPV